MTCSNRRVLGSFALFSTLLLGCAEEIENYGSVCVEPVMVDEEWVLRFEASSDDCSSDHRGAEFSCSVELDAEANEVVVSTLYRPGKDPNHACAAPRYDVCEFALGAQEGWVYVRFDDVVHPVQFPGEAVCFY
jgi:hypothetical protein